MIKKKIHYLIVLTIILMAGIWTIDVGTAGLLLEAKGAEIEILTMTGVRTTSLHYHLGLLMVVISFTALSFMYIQNLFEVRR